MTEDDKGKAFKHMKNFLAKDAEFDDGSDSDIGSQPQDLDDSVKIVDQLRANRLKHL